MFWNNSCHVKILRQPSLLFNFWMFWQHSMQLHLSSDNDMHVKIYITPTRQLQATVTLKFELFSTRQLLICNLHPCFLLVLPASSVSTLTWNWPLNSNSVAIVPQLTYDVEAGISTTSFTTERPCRGVGWLLWWLFLGIWRFGNAPIRSFFFVIFSPGTITEGNENICS